MELLEAIKSRRSIRAYKPNPVPKEVLIELLDVARWTPSGMNTQTWEFLVLTGEPLDKLNRAMLEKTHTNGPGKSEPDIDVSISFPTGLYKERAAKLFNKVFPYMPMKEWNDKSFSFFDAPTGIIIVTDRSAPQPWWLFNIGLISQTISLVAHEYGLGTCMVGKPAFFPKEVRKVLNIPESKRVVVGFAIGYPDWDNPLNSVRTDREPLGKLVTWCGMAESE